MIGLAGAHRTGKTTLARKSAEVLNLPFVQTSTSEVFASVGIDPAEPMSFSTRLMVQGLVLKDAIEKWHGYKEGFLTDRTPVDMLAYTLADVRGDTLDATGEAALAQYSRDCMTALGNFFSLIMLIQPGIPLVPAEGKASLSIGYIEHLNSLMAGIMARRDFEPDALFLSRSTLDLDDRVECVATSYKRMIKKELQQRMLAAVLH